MLIFDNRLKQSHTGDYLARELAECLKRFGIDKLVCNLYFL